MARLTWNHEEDLPYSVYGNGSERHQIGVSGDRVRVKLFCGHSVYELPLAAFLDHVFQQGAVLKGTVQSTRLTLTSDAPGGGCWIALTKDHVIVQGPTTRAKRAVGFAQIKHIVTLHGKRVGNKP